MCEESPAKKTSLARFLCCETAGTGGFDWERRNRAGPELGARLLAGELSRLAVIQGLKMVTYPSHGRHVDFCDIFVPSNDSI